MRITRATVEESNGLSEMKSSVELPSFLFIQIGEEKENPAARKEKRESSAAGGRRRREQGFHTEKKNLNRTSQKGYRTEHRICKKREILRLYGRKREVLCLEPNT